MSEKKCYSCDKIKPYEEFNKNRAKNDGLQVSCRICDRERTRLRYRKNPKLKEQILACNAARLKINRERLYAYLKSHPCPCGEDDPLMLDFNHLNPDNKFESISQMIMRGFSWKKIFDEIGKCEVICCKCHRRKTADQFGWWYNKMGS